jgi:hypothetical protein
MTAEFSIGFILAAVVVAVVTVAKVLKNIYQVLTEIRDALHKGG